MMQLFVCYVTKHFYLWSGMDGSNLPHVYDFSLCTNFCVLLRVDPPITKIYTRENLECTLNRLVANPGSTKFNARKNLSKGLFA